MSKGVTKGVTRNGQLRALALLFGAVVAGCGGGGGDSVSAPPPPAGTPPAVPEVTLRWVSSASHDDFGGESDPGVLGLNGRLVAANPQSPAAAAALTPADVDSVSVRIVGGTVSSDGRSVSNTGPRHVLFDARVGAGVHAFGLHRLSLGAADAAAAPAVQRVSSELTMCPGSLTAPRFTVIGQSLDGEQAVITYQAPDASGSCASGGLPRLVELSMATSAAPVALPGGATERVTAVAPIHEGTSGNIAAMLAWRDGQLIRISARLDAGGVTAVGAAPAPLEGSRGHITPTGIFVRSADGLRRFDKVNNLLSGVLVAGHVGSGLPGVNAMHDDNALYITSVGNDGHVDLHRVSDQLLASASKINDEGPIAGFWVLRSHVLYAVEGREGFVAYNKTTRERRVVLAGKRIELASTLHDRVFHSTPGASGRVFASSELDGSGERSLGAVQLIGGSLAEQMPAHARSLRGNGAFGHALVASRAAGATGLAGGRLQWVSFGAAAQDIEAGNFSSTLDLGPRVDAPGVFGNAVLLGVAASSGAAAPTLFVARRAAGSLAPVTSPLARVAR